MIHKIAGLLLVEISVLFTESPAKSNERIADTRCTNGG